MAKIAADTKPWVLELLNKVDTQKLTDQQINHWIQEYDQKVKGSSMFSKYLRDPNSVEKVEAPAGIPQQACDIISSVNWKKIGMLEEMAAKPYLKSWINSNLPMK